MMFLDIFEPRQIEELVAQAIPVTREPLNGKGFADYLWFCIDNHRQQWERKHIDEILSNMDGVEEQLRRWLSNGVEETGLIYEGTFEPIPEIKTACQSFRRVRDGSKLATLFDKILGHHNLLIPGHKYNISYAGVQAWFSQLDKAGITIIHTFDYISTAFTLVALYNNSQKLEHTTLQRYIKDRIYPKPYNPHILTLMGIAGANIGQEIGEALIERYGTVWYIVNQDAEDLAETVIGEKRFGLTRARKLLKAIGKEA